MLKLLSITFNNIGRFTEEQVVRFDSRGKTIQINGNNNNTGGSSGSGKTTLVNAIDYNLGLSDVPSTILQSRLTKKHAYTIGEYLVNGQLVMVKRSRKTGEGLTIITPEETVSGNVALAEEKLDELIGIPRKLFKKMTHKRQKEGGFFLKMTAKEVYEFFVELLGLKKYTDQIDLIDKDLKDIEGQITKLRHAHDAFKSSIEEYELLFDGMKEPTCDITQEEIDILNAVVIQLNNSIMELTTARDSGLSALIAPVKEIVDFDNTLLTSQKLEYGEYRSKKTTAMQDHAHKIKKLNDSKSGLVRQLTNINSYKTRAVAQGEKVNELKAEKEEILKAMCPKCKQAWAGETAQVEISRIDDQLQDLVRKILECRSIIENEPKVTSDLERLELIISQTPLQVDTSEIDGLMADINSQIVAKEARKMNVSQDADNKYLTKHREYQEQANAIKEIHNPKIEGLRDDLNAGKQDMATKSAILNAYKKSSEDFIASSSRLSKTIVEKRNGLKETIDKRQVLSKKIDVANEAKRLIKTYTLQIFQETLETIGDLATQTLSGIPNMSTAVVYFEGCKENKNGTIRDEISPILNIDGEEGVPLKSLCGGERTAIDLAVDLAVIDTIESKTGKGADFFTVDEPFTGLEDVNIEQCLSVLQQMDTNKKIIIIDHNEKVKQAVSDIITVERTGENSIVL